MNVDPTLTSDWSYRIGWTVLHSLWQGCAVAAALVPVLWLLRDRSPQARYRAAAGALAITMAYALFTCILIRSPGQSASSMTSLPSGRLVVRPEMAGGSITSKVQLERGTIEKPGDLVRRTLAPIEFSRALSGSQRQLTSWVSRAWMLGVLLLSTWRMGGWISAQRLKKIGVAPPPPTLAAALARVSNRLGLHHSVRAMESVLAQTPMVIGWLRPVILMPVAVLANLSPQQVEAIISHELAHVRRHDYVLNLLQVLVETLLFYHPAVWWMSRHIRLEREQCCDEIAVGICGDRRAYVDSLVAVEEARLGGALALAARGSGETQLLGRIRRLLGPTNDAPRHWARGIAAAAIWLGAGIAALAGPHIVGTPATVPMTQPAANAIAPDAAPPDVLLVTNGNYLLERALDAATVKPADFLAYRMHHVAPHQVTVFDRWTPAETQPGAAIYFGVIPPEAAVADHDPAGHLMHVNGAGIDGWNRTHPILRGLDLSKLYVASALKLRTTNAWQALASGTKGPLILARDQIGQRQIVVGFDVMESNWPVQVSFPIFLHQSIQWLLKEEPVTKASADNIGTKASTPVTQPAAHFRADCVLSALADGKREVLASPTLNLQDGGETSFLFTGKPPVIIQELPSREPGVLGKVSVQRQPDGRLRLVCRIGHRALNDQAPPGDNQSALAEATQKLAEIDRTWLESLLLCRVAEKELSFRQGMGKYGATPYTAQEISRVDPLLEEKQKQRVLTEMRYQELITNFGSNYPTVLAVKQSLELWRKSIEEDVRKFNDQFLIVSVPDGHQSPRVVPRDLTNLWVVHNKYRSADKEARAALQEIQRVGGIKTDQTVKPGEPVAFELDDGTRLEVSVHPSAQ